MSRQAIVTSDFWIAVIVVAFLCALCMLIMGIFTIDNGSFATMTALTVLLLAGPLFLLWMLFVGMVLTNPRSRVLTNVVIYGVGPLVVLLGSWQCVERLAHGPVYQEASVATAASIPAY